MRSWFSRVILCSSRVRCPRSSERTYSVGLESRSVDCIAAAACARGGDARGLADGDAADAVAAGKAAVVVSGCSARPNLRADMNCEMRRVAAYSL